MWLSLIRVVIIAFFTKKYKYDYFLLEQEQVLLSSNLGRNKKFLEFLHLIFLSFHIFRFSRSLHAEQYGRKKYRFRFSPIGEGLSGNILISLIFNFLWMQGDIPVFSIKQITKKK